MCEMVLGLKPGIWHYVYVRCYVVYLEPNITVSGQDGGAPKVPELRWLFPDWFRLRTQGQVWQSPGNYTLKHGQLPHEFVLNGITLYVSLCCIDEDVEIVTETINSLGNSLLR